MTEEEFQEWRRRIEASKRPGFGYHSLQTKPEAEREAARDALLGAGFDLGGDLRSIPENEDPPDCEATINGVLCGVEVSELLHQEALEQTIQARVAIKRGKEPEKPEGYFGWERYDLQTELQRIIARKDQPKFKIPRCYPRYFLIIHTMEMILDRHTVAEYLREATFYAGFITDALLLLDTHRSEEGHGSYHPIFSLTLRRDGTTEEKRIVAEGTQPL